MPELVRKYVAELVTGSKLLVELATELQAELATVLRTALKGEQTVLAPKPPGVECLSRPDTQTDINFFSLFYIYLYFWFYCEALCDFYL